MLIVYVAYFHVLVYRYSSTNRKRIKLRKSELDSCSHTAATPALKHITNLPNRVHSHSASDIS